MGRELTRRHASLFEKRAKHLFSFARDVYKYDKTGELASFVVWEILHKLKLFPKSRYLRFKGGAPFTLATDRLVDPPFTQSIDRFFADCGLSLTRPPHNWKVLFISKGGQYVGCLHGDPRELYGSHDNGATLHRLEAFPQPVKAAFVTSRNTVVVSVQGSVYTRAAGAQAFKKAFDFASPVSFFRHNNAITETPDKTLIIGEYGNVWDDTGWRRLANLYFSSDDGDTWQKSDFLIERGANKHVHLVKYSKTLDRVLVADGDNRKRLWVSGPASSVDLRSPDHWRTANRFHIQMGGYTSAVESGGTVFFGTDYQGGTNFLVQTRDGRTFEKRVVPDPYRRSPLDNMTQRRSAQGIEIWANLPYSTRGTKCLLMYTVDAGQSWTRLIEYDRSTHKVWLISSSQEIAEELYFSIEDLRTGDRVVYRVAG